MIISLHSVVSGLPLCHLLPFPPLPRPRYFYSVWILKRIDILSLINPQIHVIICVRQCFYWGMRVVDECMHIDVGLFCEQINSSLYFHYSTLWILTCSLYSIWENLMEDFQDFSFKMLFLHQKSHSHHNILYNRYRNNLF